MSVTKFTTVQKAAKLYEISEEHLLGWINHKDSAKRLPAVNISNTGNRPRWRIEIAKLDEFLAERSNVQSLPRTVPKRRPPKPSRQYV